MKNKKLFFIPLVLTFFLTGCLAPVDGGDSNGNNNNQGGNGGNTNPDDGGNTDKTGFPAAELQSFLTSQNLTTRVPSPMSNTVWTNEVVTEDGDTYFYATTEDKGTLGIDAIEDTYKAKLISDGWTIDADYYDLAGYYADKGDVTLEFFTYDGSFEFYASAASSGSSGEESDTFPATQLQAFLTSEGLATTVPSPNGGSKWTYYTDSDDSGNYFFAKTDDTGTPTTDAIEDTYKAQLTTAGWTIDDSAYDEDGYYANKGDVEIQFYSYNDEFKMWVYSAESGQGGSGGGTDTPTSSLTAIVEGILNETYSWEASTDGNYLDTVFDVPSGTPEQNCTQYYNALIAAGFTSVTAPQYDTYYDDGTYYAELYYQETSNETYIYAWDQTENGTTYHVVQIGVIADGQSGGQQEDNDELFDGPSAPFAEAEWTLMFYVCGADLESDSQNRLATEDIKEILSVTGKPDNVNIIFETGGASSWSSALGIKSTRLERFHVANGALVNDSQLENDSMGKPETLQSFLEWGMTYFPAEKYGVFMWNHGGAMDGCCFDELYHDDSLTNYELNKAVTDAKTTCNVDKLEFIAYDACLMAIQDIAETNSHNFNYMLASQESESGYGYDYDEWLPDLYANPTTIATKDLLEEIGHTFMEEEKAIYQQYSEPFDQTQSAYDLSKMATYKDAFEDLATSLKSLVSESQWNSFVSNNVNKSNVQKYGADDNNNYLYDIFDAEDVLNNIKSNYSSLSSKVDACLAALNDLVVYEEHGSATSGCGLNIYCPINSMYNRYSAKDTNFNNWYSLCEYSDLCIE